MGLLNFLGIGTKKAEEKPNGKAQSFPEEPVKRKKRRTTLVKVDQLLAAEEEAEEADEVEKAVTRMRMQRTNTANQFTETIDGLDDELKEQLRKAQDNGCSGSI